MNSTIIFLSFSLILLTLMLKFKIRINIDYNSSTITIYIYLYNIRIFKIELFMYGLYYKINSNKKINSLSLIISKEQKYFLVQIKKSIIDKLYLNNVILVNNINSGFPDIDAISKGFLDALSIILIKFIKNNYKDKKIKIATNTNFGNCSNSEMQLFVYFTIFDLIFALVFSLYKRGKYVRNTKKRMC